MAARSIPPNAGVVLGLRANWPQFSLLVLVNAFVGAMVGLERTLLPLIAEQEFGLVSRSAVLAFLVSFGLVKAVANFVAGSLADRVGRKPVLVVGWLVGAPVPVLLMMAPTWSWVVFANVLLGINQGLAWSMTVTMKIDLVGPSNRGLAMGLNEFAGYIAVAFSAFATGYVASRFGLLPEPFYLGIAFVVLGLAISIFFVRETREHVDAEARMQTPGPEPAKPLRHGGEVFAQVTWRDPALMSASQAGLVNNLNDGLAWGLFPLFFASAGLGIEQIGILAAAYPATWGILQLGTGALSDRWGRKWLIVGGMAVQGVALGSMVMFTGFATWFAAAVLLGAGTAMVYPTLLAAVADVAGPTWRGSAVGVYRFWRDSGYAVGAVVAGVLADAYDVPFAIGAIGALTLASGAVVAWRMPETRRANRNSLAA